MASVVDICNLALGHLGNSATVASISPQDGSVEAMHCARFYPMARNILLESEVWSFALRREALALTAEEPPPDFLFTYAYTNNCLKIHRLLSEGSARPPFRDSVGEDFKVELLADGTKVIFTNVAGAVAVFTQATTDTTKFSALFVQALSRLLASFLAGPLIKGTTGMKISQEQYKLFLLERAQAIASEAQQRQGSPRDTYVPSGIAARG